MKKSKLPSSQVRIDGETAKRLDELTTATGLSNTFWATELIMAATNAMADGRELQGLAEYLADTRYFGALIGRYANRIAGARFTLHGIDYRLTSNAGRNQLHGGPGGLHSVLWTVEPFRDASGSGATLTCSSGAEVCRRSHSRTNGDSRMRVPSNRRRLGS